MTLGILTHSRISSWQKCRRHHQWRYVLGLRPERDSEALRIGTQVHQGIDWLAQGHPMEHVCSWIATAYQAYPDWCGSWEQRHSWDREGEVVLRLLVAYHWHWAGDEAEVVATEQEFLIPITHPETGEPHPDWEGLGGKVDKIMANGDVAFLREHKTTSLPIGETSPYRLKLAMDHQIRLYTIAAQSLGYPVEWVEYDVIKKPGTRPKKLAKATQKVLKETGRYCGEDFKAVEVPPERETIKMYGARLLSEISGKAGETFQRWHIDIFERDIDEMKAELWSIACAMAFDIKAGRDFRNPANCIAPWQCEFFNLCRVGCDPAKDTPGGFVRDDNVHQELETL